MTFFCVPWYDKFCSKLYNSVIFSRFLYRRNVMVKLSSCKSSNGSNLTDSGQWCTGTVASWHTISCTKLQLNSFHFKRCWIHKGSCLYLPLCCGVTVHQGCQSYVRHLRKLSIKYRSARRISELELWQYSSTQRSQMGMGGKPTKLFQTNSSPAIWCILMPQNNKPLELTLWYLNFREVKDGCSFRPTPLFPSPTSQYGSKSFNRN